MVRADGASKKGDWIMKTTVVKIIYRIKQKFAHRSRKPFLSTLIIGTACQHYIYSPGCQLHCSAWGHLWLIGQRFGVTVEEIKQASGIWYDRFILAIFSPYQITTLTQQLSSSLLPVAAAVHHQVKWSYWPNDQAEAEGEPYEGKVAVGAVILNRLQDPAFLTLLSVFT